MNLTESTVSCFVSADWSKCPGKRAVYVADVGKRRIRVQTGTSWDVGTLLDLAEQQDGPVLIGVDVVLGVPKGYWQMVLEKHPSHTPENFVDWLRSLDPSGEFFETVHQPTEWRVERPWFKVPKGKGGRTSFTNKVEGGILRRIDAATGAKPVFAVAGIPGSVGSGTRDFWKELVPHLQGDKGFAVWPFEGDLPSMLKRHGIVLCETYPALAYAEALPDGLPPGRPAKKNRTWRDCMCNRSHEGVREPDRPRAAGRVAEERGRFRCTRHGGGLPSLHRRGARDCFSRMDRPEGRGVDAARGSMMAVTSSVAGSNSDLHNIDSFRF